MSCCGKQRDGLRQPSFSSQTGPKWTSGPVDFAIHGPGTVDGHRPTDGDCLLLFTQDTSARTRCRRTFAGFGPQLEACTLIWRICGCNFFHPVLFGPRYQARADDNPEKVRERQ